MDAVQFEIDGSGGPGEADGLDAISDVMGA